MLDETGMCNTTPPTSASLSRFVWFWSPRKGFPSETSFQRPASRACTSTQESRSGPRDWIRFDQRTSPRPKTLPHSEHSKPPAPGPAVISVSLPRNRAAGGASAFPRNLRVRGTADGHSHAASPPLPPALARRRMVTPSAANSRSFRGPSSAFRRSIQARPLALDRPRRWARERLSSSFALEPLRHPSLLCSYRIVASGGSHWFRRLEVPGGISRVLRGG